MQHHHGSARNVARIASISSPIPGDYALGILFNYSAYLTVLLSGILQLLLVDCKACYEPTQTIRPCPIRADFKVSETSTSCSMKLCMFNGSVSRGLQWTWTKYHPTRVIWRPLFARNNFFNSILQPIQIVDYGTLYLLLTEPSAVGAWFWRRRSRAIWSVTPDTLQPAADSESPPGPGWFRPMSTDSVKRESG